MDVARKLELLGQHILFDTHAYTRAHAHLFLQELNN